jgi:hypothetical protein
MGTVEDDLPMEVEGDHQVKFSSCEPRCRPPPASAGGRRQQKLFVSFSQTTGRDGIGSNKRKSQFDLTFFELQQLSEQPSTSPSASNSVFSNLQG